MYQAFEVVAAKPKASANANLPTQTPMREGSKILRNPTNDQKKIRRLMGKSAGRADMDYVVTENANGSAPTIHGGPWDNGIDQDKIDSLLDAYPGSVQISSDWLASSVYAPKTASHKIGYGESSFLNEATQLTQEQAQYDRFAVGIWSEDQYEAYMHAWAIGKSEAQADQWQDNNFTNPDVERLFNAILDKAGMSRGGSRRSASDVAGTEAEVNDLDTEPWDITDADVTQSMWDDDYAHGDANTDAVTASWGSGSDCSSDTGAPMTDQTEEMPKEAPPKPTTTKPNMAAQSSYAAIDDQFDIRPLHARAASRFLADRPGV